MLPWEGLGDTRCSLELSWYCRVRCYVHKLQVGTYGYLAYTRGLFVRADGDVRCWYALCVELWAVLDGDSTMLICCEHACMCYMYRYACGLWCLRRRLKNRTKRRACKKTKKQNTFFLPSANMWRLFQSCHPTTLNMEGDINQTWILDWRKRTNCVVSPLMNDSVDSCPTLHQSTM